MRVRRSIKLILAGSVALTHVGLGAEEAREPEGDAPKEPSVLAIFAHPDDEVTVGPLLARVTRGGGEVTLIYATSGDQGPGVSSMERGAALAKHREGEARCAATALGARTVVFLQHGDGTLGENAHHPGSSAEKLLADVTTLIREAKPNVVVTWGPDGGYGHADHRMVSAIVTQVVLSMPDETRPVLFYPAIIDGTLPPVEELQRWATVARDLVSSDVPYEQEDLEAAAKALDCHASQFDAQTRAGLVPLFDQSIWRGKVHLRNGAPRQQPRLLTATD